MMRKLSDKSITIRGKVVSRINIIGTNTCDYSAWEPTAIMGRHSSITTFGPGGDPFHGRQRWYGRIGSRPLPARIDRIPAGPERSRAVDRFQARQDRLGRGLIRRAFGVEVGKSGCKPFVSGAISCPCPADGSVGRAGRRGKKG